MSKLFVVMQGGVGGPRVRVGVVAPGLDKTLVPGTPVDLHGERPRASCLHCHAELDAHPLLLWRDPCTAVCAHCYHPYEVEARQAG